MYVFAAIESVYIPKLSYLRFGESVIYAKHIYTWKERNECKKLNDMGDITIRLDKSTETSKADIATAINSVETAYLAVQALTLNIVNRIELGGNRLDRDGIIVGLHGLNNAINVLNKYVSDVQDIADRMDGQSYAEYQSITNAIKAKLSLMRRSTELGIAELPDSEVQRILETSELFTDRERYIAIVVLYNERLMELRGSLVQISSLVGTLRK